MLSRIAKGLYETGREIERAQNIIRVLEVQHKMHVARQTWNVAAVWMPIFEAFAVEAADEPSEHALYGVLVLDSEHPFSVRGRIASARARAHARCARASARRCGSTSTASISSWRRCGSRTSVGSGAPSSTGRSRHSATPSTAWPTTPWSTAPSGIFAPREVHRARLHAVQDPRCQAQDPGPRSAGRGPETRLPLRGWHHGRGLQSRLFFERGGGVCQDFSHATIGVLRRAGVPARYASGYVYDPAVDSTHPTLRGAAASHAWVQAWHEELGWVGLDPTNDKLVDWQYVRVAVGRDYGDVQPVRGIFRGEGEQMLSVAVEVTHLRTEG